MTDAKLDSMAFLVFWKTSLARSVIRAGGASAISLAGVDVVGDGVDEVEDDIVLDVDAEAFDPAACCQRPILKSARDASSSGKRKQARRSC
jgi:hypothetical protein